MSVGSGPIAGAEGREDGALLGARLDRFVLVGGGAGRIAGMFSASRMRPVSTVLEEEREERRGRCRGTMDGMD